MSAPNSQNTGTTASGGTGPLAGLRKDEIASISSAGTTVTLRGGSDEKAKVEAEMLRNRMNYHPLKSQAPMRWDNQRF
ncbi:MAG: hypothetical protein IJH68_08575 [Thermoguttaceae bacterium]|nr:hypothetical protein [Thermoguttaceae bacterium]